MLKKLGIAFACGVVFAAGLVGAQTINRAIQLSQDPTGIFGVDTNFNVYFPRNVHMLFTGTGGPPPTTASTGCVMVTGSTDFNGTMTGCTGASNVVTFGTAFVTAPRCVASSSSATSAALAITTTTTALTITATAATANFVWFCSSVS